MLKYHPVIMLSQCNEKLQENVDPETANKGFSGLMLPVRAHMVTNNRLSIAEV